MKHQAIPGLYRKRRMGPSLLSQWQPWAYALVYFFILGAGFSTKLSPEEKFLMMFPLVQLLALVFAYDMIRWCYHLIIVPHLPYAQIREVMLTSSGIRLVVAGDRYQEIGWGGVSAITREKSYWLVSFFVLPDLILSDAALSEPERSMLQEHVR